MFLVITWTGCWYLGFLSYDVNLPRSFDTGVFWRVNLSKLVFVFVLHEILVHHLVLLNLVLALITMCLSHQVDLWTTRLWHHLDLELASIGQLSCCLVVFLLRLEVILSNKLLFVLRLELLAIFDASWVWDAMGAFSFAWFWFLDQHWLSHVDAMLFALIRGIVLI